MSKISNYEWSYFVIMKQMADREMKKPECYCNTSLLNYLFPRISLCTFRAERHVSGSLFSTMRMYLDQLRGHIRKIDGERERRIDLYYD